MQVTKQYQQQKLFPCSITSVCYMYFQNEQKPREKQYD